MRSIPESQWVWQGFPGHFIGAYQCGFRLCTVVGNVIVSSVGAYRPKSDDGGIEAIGYQRTYETFVFRAGNPDPYSGEITPGVWGEIDTAPANTPTEARENHLAMCRLWSSGEKQAEALKGGDQ